MTALLRDVRHSLSLIHKHPAHAFAVLLTLAVAIGAGTVVIALVDHIVLRPLPFANSERVVRIHETHESVGKYWGASYPDIREWTAASKSFDAFALARTWSATLTTPSGTKGFSAGIATPQWFAIQSLRPALGRFFNDDEMRSGANHVVVLTDKMWRETFGGDPRILQRDIRLDAKPFRVVGVLPPHPWIYEFDWVSLWMPLSATPDDIEKRSWRGFAAIGRLRPGVTPAAAKQELAAIQRRVAQTYADDNGVGVDFELLRNEIAGPARRLLFIFAASIGVVLLIACANVANLSLAFNSWRTREFAVRHALGASSGRIARQILIESLVLALLGGALGLVIAHNGLHLFRALAPDDIPRLDEVAIDGRVAFVTMALSVVSALLFGFAPARTAARSGAPTSGRATDSGTRMRRLLVIGELALAFIVVIAAGLMTRAFTRLMGWNPGFRTRDVVVVWTYARDGTASPDAVEMFDRAAKAIRAIPGVREVGQTSSGPLFGGGDSDEIRIVGRADSTKHSERFCDISPNYFDALGIRLLRGRAFRDADRQGTQPVMMINEAMAKHYWADANPIGSQVAVEGQQWQIVGVVANVHPFRPDEDPAPEIYFPKRQWPRSATYFVIRTDRPRAAVEREVKDVLKKNEPVLQIGSFHSLDDLAAEHRVAPRFNIVVISTLSILAYALAAIGIYGLVAFSVVTRGREIAIRLAVGADAKRVVRGIVADGGRMLTAGLIIGAVGAVALMRLLSTFLFGLSPFDAMAWIAVSIAFSAIVLIACWIPALRAASIDPAASLRVE